jgi:hypothetical protein
LPAAKGRSAFGRMTVMAMEISYQQEFDATGCTPQAAF